MSKGKVLIISSDAELSETIVQVLEQAEFDVVAAANKTTALDLAKSDVFELVVANLTSPDHSSLGILRHLKDSFPTTEIIMSSTNPTLDSAIASIREGAYDYLWLPQDLTWLPESASGAIMRRRRKMKIFAPDEVGETSEDAMERTTSSGAVRGHVPDPAEELSASVMIGDTPSMVAARQLLLQVASSDMTVLVRGESGTGKDVAARLIHRVSPRNETGTFVKITCPAVPESLLESELFGYERGAFTGAVAQKPGRFELAGKGTIFLDEIGSISLAMQAKLLDVIEHKQFTRVGGVKTITVDARIIAATHCPLEEMIARGEFRADLFYRLEQFTITLPPLRERTEDILRLCRHFLRSHAAKYGFKHRKTPFHIMDRLVRYPWPGNVRELESTIARFALTGEIATFEDVMEPASGESPASAPVASKLEEVEVAAIKAALEETRWNRRKAAEKLGISYSALRRRLAKYDLEGRSNS